MMPETAVAARAAYEALEARGLVATKIHRYPLDTVVVLRIPDTEEFAFANLAYDPHFPSSIVAGWVKFRDPATGRWVHLDGKGRALSWLQAARETPVSEFDGVTTYLRWRN